MQTGSCLCGSVTIKVQGDLGQPDACHCSQCRKQSGHIWASSDVLKSDLAIEGAENLTWFAASEKIRRGFCSKCGSFLFWDRIGGEKIAIAMGCLDSPTHTKLAHHIFVADKGDYYEIADGVPQNQQ